MSQNSQGGQQNQQGNQQGGQQGGQQETPASKPRRPDKAAVSSKVARRISPASKIPTGKRKRIAR